MNVVFLGDICVSGKSNFSFDLEKLKFDFVVANLEGAIRPDDGRDIVANSKSVVDYLKLNFINFVTLANNHIFDDLKSFLPTIRLLENENINWFGAGECLSQAIKPLMLSSSESKMVCFSFGLDIIGCKNTFGRAPGVNPFNINHLFKTIKEMRKKDKNSVVVYLFHWNYELELYPQPMYRQLAFDLIDSGVDAIIGMHPHIAQGAELYNGKPIVYSLGNWLFPPRKLGSMSLKFPEISNRQLALGLELKERKQIVAKFHWFQFNPDDCSISLEATEDWSGKILQELTPFREMSHKKYCKWFKKNRRKSFFLPIYYNYKNNICNKCKDGWVKIRQLVIKLLLKYRLKNSPK